MEKWAPAGAIAEMMRSHGADEEGLGDSDLDDARERLELRRAKFADDPGRGDEE